MTEPGRTLWTDLRGFWELLHGQKKQYATGLTALFIVNLADVISPIFMAVAIDLTEAELTGARPKTTPVLTTFGLETAQFTLAAAVAIYLALQIAANVFRYPMLMYVAVPSHEIGQGVRRKLVGHLMRLSRPFFDKAKSGDLMTLATNDVNAIRMAMGPGVLVGSDTLIIVALVLLVLFSLSWQLTLITMIPLPFIAYITNKLSHADFTRFQDVQGDLGALTERVRESYAGIRILQGFAREAFDRARFLDFSTRHLRKNLGLARVRAIFDPTLDLMLGFSTTMVLVFGGLQVVSGTLSLGTFVAFLFLVRYLAGPMIGFGWSVSLVQRGRASMHRLETLWQTPVEIEDGTGAQNAQGTDGLEVRNLTFSYPTGTGHALADITLRIEPGRSLGLIGPVGSGKSTLAQLMVRLYDPPPDTIFWEGEDIRHITLSSLRADIVLAPQDTFLFSDTVARNLTLAVPSAEAEVERFARLAQLHSEIEQLPRGYQTRLGERGVNLSGGQRQRLAIARAIAADPKLLILDDCLSAVDASTERDILDGLDVVFQDRAGVIVSHRVCAVQRCDEIIVLDQGRVIERGNHDTLIRQQGWYASIAAEQANET